MHCRFTGHLQSTMTPRVSIQESDFDLSAEVATLRAGNPGVGAVCAFVGTVRDRNAVGDASAVPNAALNGDTVLSMELEHYPGMTERAIEAMVDDAFSRFNILGRARHPPGRRVEPHGPDRAGGCHLGPPWAKLPGL
jgi:molybdopterin synthase catalytic subunit